MFRGLGIKDLQGFDAYLQMGMTSKLELCKAATEARIRCCCNTNLKGQEAIATQQTMKRSKVMHSVLSLLADRTKLALVPMDLRYGPGVSREGVKDIVNKCRSLARLATKSVDHGNSSPPAAAATTGRAAAART